MTALSVLTASYNYAAYLPRCLASVDAVAARGLDVQHVVVDDRSSDDSVAVLAQAGGDHRLVIEHKRNQGLSATLNTALSHAEGDWVGWLNADDSYDTDGLVRVVGELDRLPDSVGLVYGDVRRLYSDGEPADVYRLYSGATSCLRMGYNPLLVPSVLLRRTALDRFDERFQLLMDFDAYLTVLRRYRPRYVPFVIGEWRMHADQRCVNPAAEDLDEWRYLATKHRCLFRTGPTRRGRIWSRALKLAQLRYFAPRVELGASGP